MAYYTKIGFFLLFSSTLLVVWPLFLNFNLKPVAVTRLRRHDGGGGEEEYGDNDNVEEVVENDTDGTNSPDKKKSFLRPEIAWLMSFPCSGTSYTIDNTQRVSNTSMATNYLNEAPNKIPLYSAGGPPYIIRPIKSLPPSFILTKTHCKGYWDLRDAQSSFIPYFKFEEGCRTNEYMNETYPSSIVPKRAVHLIRNPFDNIVARFHMSVRRRKKLGGWRGDEAAAFTNNREGLLAWCNYGINQYPKDDSIFPEEGRKILKDVPCYADFLRYVQWHNLAILVIKDHQLPTHNLFYENYTKDFDGTVKHLLNFLQLPVRDHPKPFITGKAYTDWFDPKEAQAVARLVREMATPECWALLRHYVEEWIDEPDKRLVNV